MLPKQLRFIIDKYCMGVVPSDSQMDEIMNLCATLSADMNEASDYIQRMIDGDMPTSYSDEGVFGTRTIKQNVCKQKSKASSPQKLSIRVNGVSINMIKVEAGAFMMGVNSGDRSAEDCEKPQHQVTLTRDYYLGETQVTQSLWEAVMGYNPSETVGERHPVDNVSWNECVLFTKLLSQLTNQKFRLPTEAEWEFGARGGNKSKGYKYSGSDTLKQVAWYGGDLFSRHKCVAQKAPNELGLYDMSGNMEEWCIDYKGDYDMLPETDPRGPESNKYNLHIYRGGYDGSDANGCRVSARSWKASNDRAIYIGLRLCMDV